METEMGNGVLAFGHSASVLAALAIKASRGLTYMVNLEPKIFHRDIRPANVLLNRPGPQKIRCPRALETLVLSVVSPFTVEKNMKRTKNTSPIFPFYVMC